MTIECYGSFRYGIWRVVTGLHNSVEFNFMEAGHTQFHPDWHFGLWTVLVIKWISIFLNVQFVELFVCFNICNYSVFWRASIWWMWNNFQSFIREKERMWNNGTKTVQNHPMQHTHTHKYVQWNNYLNFPLWW